LLAPLINKKFLNFQLLFFKTFWVFLKISVLGATSGVDPIRLRNAERTARFVFVSAASMEKHKNIDFNIICQLINLDVADLLLSVNLNVELKSSVKYNKSILIKWTFPLKFHLVNDWSHRLSRKRPKAKPDDNE
jgi:hypothetical protein